MKIINEFKVFKDTIALEDSKRRLTYEELDNITSYLALNIKVPKDEIIGLEFKKSINYIIALFAILKKGNPFVVLNKELPQERLNYIKHTLNLKYVFSEEDLIITLNGFDKAQNYSFTKHGDDLDDLAYVIFTSGSTGNPKGVKVTHRGIYNIINEQIKEFELQVGSKNLLLNSISFDASLSDIYSTLLSGGTLCIEDSNRNIVESLDYFSITHIDISPSILNILYKEPIFKSLNTIIVGGELISENVIKQLANDVKIVNAYGPTETTICTSMKVIKNVNDLNCIGKPIPNVEYLIEDGELIIATHSCADGYWNLKSNNFYTKDNMQYYKTGDYVTYVNGEYYFSGRLDRQVKIKGFRVELEEIEKIIKRDTSAENVAVIYKNNQLVSFSTQPIYKEQLTSLPYYMIPNRFITIDEFKLNSNGKIDYHLLELMSADKDTKTLVDIFKEVLNKEISEEDDWNSLGGDSLSLIQLIVSLEEENYDIKVEDILKGIKIKDLLYASNHTMKLSKEYLDESISPIIYKNYDCQIKQQEEVLITGVTGYLGIHLLELLLKQNNKERFTCLVRGNSIVEVKNRIISLFNQYQLDISLLNFNLITIVLGDISKERFGLSSKKYNELKNKITKVIHSAALVNNLLPYESIFQTNVQGTMEIIKLQKPIHYISTLSVFVGSDKNEGIAYEEDDLSDIKYFYGGYAQSKYVAEYLVKKSNLPLVIYRLGLLTGNTTKTNHNPKEFLSMLLKGLLKIKTLPDVELNKFSLDVSPIDYVTGIIIDIYKQSNYNMVYHIANKEGASLQLIYDTLISNNIDIKKIPPIEFKRLIFNTQMDTNIKSLLLTLCRFDEDLYAKYRYCDLLQKTGIEFDMTNTQKLIPNIIFPKVDIDLMNHYLTSVKDDNYV